MYGYVTPVKEKMLCKDFALYRAYYCGICKATGRLYGQLPRFTTNYDIVFLSVLMHDILTQSVDFETGGCICNPFKKKVSVMQNPLLNKIIETNIILSYHKSCDGVIDKEGLKHRFAKSMLKRHYKKARANSPEIDALVIEKYDLLRQLEDNNEKSIDKAADCFASLLSEIATVLLGDKQNQNVLGLCYNVGKFVYLADALDDIGDDYKKKRYNPFLARFGGFTTRKKFIDDNKTQLEFVIATCVNRAIECFNNLPQADSYTLLKNIVHIGLRDKVAELLSSTKKLPKPRL